VLVITDAGSFLLLDGSGQVVWSPNSTAAATARLLESGNLVVMMSDDPSSSGVILWQSFDHPSNTLLPGMKIGKNLWTGGGWSLSSWRSPRDPSPGRYRYTTDARGVPENVLWDGDVERYRTGPWNGLWFSGVSEMTTYADMFAYQLTRSPGEVTYGYTARPGAPFSRLLLTDTGVVQRLVWDATTRAWRTFFQAPRDVCDPYGKCGAFGVCDAGAASTSFCGCPRGFDPAYPAEWRMRDASGGCRRNASLGCIAGNGTVTTDGFLVLRGVKLPDTSEASVDAAITLEECGARCLANCSCVAYAPVDIRGGGAGSGCIIWTKGLVDLRYVDGGQDLYLRSAKSELGMPFYLPLPKCRPTVTVELHGWAASLPNCPLLDIFGHLIYHCSLSKRKIYNNCCEILTGQIKSPHHRSFPTATVVGASVASFIVVVLIIISLVLLATRRPIFFATRRPITSSKTATLFDLLSQLPTIIKKRGRRDKIMTTMQASLTCK
jgi:hypothetical protein